MTFEATKSGVERRCWAPLYQLHTKVHYAHARTALSLWDRDLDAHARKDVTL